MPLLVPALLIGTGAITAAGGAANAIRGQHKMRRARRDAAHATDRYQAEIAVTQEATAATSARLQAYGDRQEEALQVVVHRMIDFMRRYDQTVSERASELLAGVAVGAQEVSGFAGARITAEGVAGHLVTTTVASAATYAGVPMAVAAYGSASTGTAIAGLSGAAAQNATLAWLGGGSISAGGGGMALGAVSLNAVAIGPAILVGGFVMNGKGEKALTESQRYCAEVDASVQEQRRLRTRLSLVDERVQELDDVLENITGRGTEALDELESMEPFDPDAHAGTFRQALSFAIAVRDVIAVPVLDANGDVDPDTERLLVLYRDMP
jgi:hypothetical protein